MPIQYKVDRANRLVRTTAWGELSNEEVLIHQQSLKVDSEFNPEFRQYLDFMAVDDFRVTPECIRSLASSNPWGEDARRVFVASDDLAFGMLRIHLAKLGHSSQKIAIFRTPRDAQDWLQLSATAEDSSASLNR